MTSATSLELETGIRFDAAGFDRLIQNRIDPAWLTELRRNGWADFERLEWPDPRNENWMRSDLRGFRLDRYIPTLSEVVSDTVASATAESAPVRLLEGVAVGGTIRSIDGVVTHASLDAEYQNKGVIFGSLSKCARDHAALVKQHLFAQIDPTLDRFAALEAAMWADGYFVYVPRNVVVDRPLHIHAAMRDGRADLSHTLIVLEEGCKPRC